MIRILFAVAIISLTQACSIQQKSQKIDELINAEIDNQGIPGLSATIYQNGKIVYTKGFGFASIEKHQIVDPSKTKFRVASISKTMTSALLSRLDQDGFFHLDSSVYVYLDSFPRKKHDFTVRQLGGHLAGIRSYKDDEWWSNDFYGSVSKSIEIFINDSLLFKPGSEYKYSTYGYNLLSWAIERGMRGQTFRGHFVKYMYDSLMIPFKMWDTYTNNKRLRNNNLDLSEFYKIKDGKPLIEREVDLSNKWAGGGYESTSEDIASFAQQYWFTDYVSDSIRHEYTKTNYLTNGEATNYGVGWVIKEDPQGHTWYGHAGGGVGGVSIMMVYPKEEIVIVLLCNASNAKIKTLYESVAKVMLED